ncbi:hypothetical protein [Methanooceanicella nereidis]|nr:hypothetical protein [Methanocella sp. CWC-04]
METGEKELDKSGEAIEDTEECIQISDVKTTKASKDEPSKLKNQPK